ncbi:hypothetical protein H1R20_g6885, partial [Candolleomyces eurysporus]
MYYLDSDGSLIPYTEEPRGGAVGEGQELVNFVPSTSPSNRDYVARARYLVGNQSQSSEAGTSAASALEVRRAIAKLDRATMELREGILEDEDAERRIQAEVLLNAYSRELERKKASASSSGLLINTEVSGSTSATTPQRVCQGCYDEIYADVPARLYNSGGTALERVVVDQERLTIPGRLTRRQSSSQLSDLADCPVCYQSLDEVGGPAEQELHVKNCLEGGKGATPETAKYLVYRLPAESTLLGVECVICLEEFVKGSMVARLSCFCSFHSACLSSWLQRGKSCPVHAR